MCIDVSSSPTTPAARRPGAGAPPKADAHTSSPASRNEPCSSTSPAGWCRARWWSSGACHAHTTISSSTDAGIGVTARGHRNAGSRRVPAAPSASIGAATATTPICIAMWAAKEPSARTGSGPSHRAARTRIPAMKRMRRMGVSRKEAARVPLRSIAGGEEEDGEGDVDRRDGAQAGEQEGGETEKAVA